MVLANHIKTAGGWHILF